MKCGSGLGVLSRGGCQDPFRFSGKLRLVLSEMGQPSLFQSEPETSFQWMGTPEKEKKRRRRPPEDFTVAGVTVW